MNQLQGSGSRIQEVQERFDAQFLAVGKVAISRRQKYTGFMNGLQSAGQRIFSAFEESQRLAQQRGPDALLE